MPSVIRNAVPNDKVKKKHKAQYYGIEADKYLSLEIGIWRSKILQTLTNVLVSRESETINFSKCISDSSLKENEFNHANDEAFRKRIAVHFRSAKR